MDGNAIIAIVGGVLAAFLVRVFNTLSRWLAKVLAVDPPDPIPALEDLPNASPKPKPPAAP